MTYKVLLSKALPFPPLSLGGNTIEAQVFEKNSDSNAGAQVYCTTAVDAADADLIKSLPDSVGLIANIGVGTDNIDLAAAAARGILVSNTPVVTEDTADLAFGLILSACRRISANESFLRAGEWSAQNPLGAMGQSVHGKTLGILGFGAIGQAVARRAQGFGMTIIYHAPRQKLNAEKQIASQFEPDLKTFLSRVDIVTLHCPLTPLTKHVLNTDTLAGLRKGIVVVNSGRGALIDEAALVGALQSGHVAAAGLDVFEFEPKVHPDLLSMENVTLTPHIGSATQECRTQMVMRTIGNIMNFLEHGKPHDEVRA